MSGFLFKGGEVIDPVKKTKKREDILVRDGVVAAMGPNLKEQAVVIDCRQKVIVPGLIDLHVHARTPGQEYKEDLESISRAAAAGGFTSIFAMANTVPVIDNQVLWERNQELAKTIGLVNFYQVMAITKGQKGKMLVDDEALSSQGLIAVSDDGQAIQDLNLLAQAMLLCKRLGLRFLIHCEEKGYPPQDKRSEYFYINTVLKIMEMHNCKNVHIQHVSTLESVQLLREAKSRRLKVTAETCPHYLSLTHRALKTTLGGNAKMNPPLRAERDRQAVIEGVIDGTIDAISTDHAPHSAEEKIDLKTAPYGIIGLETAVPVILSALQNRLSLPDIFAKLTIKPATILGLKDQGLIVKGKFANLTVIDLKKRRILEAEDLYSKSQNSPWLGKRLQGWPVLTMREGKIRMLDGQVLA